MTAEVVELEGSQKVLALVSADLHIVQGRGFERPREVQIALSHLLGGLGESLYTGTDVHRRVYVARHGTRVVTLCFRRHTDSGSLQVAYDSAVDRT